MGKIEYQLKNLKYKNFYQFSYLNKSQKYPSTLIAINALSISKS